MVVMVVLITNIISDYKRQIIRLATKDELTGLANRKSFNTEFREFMENPAEKTCSLFLLDIDFFKQINDNYGHAAGDNALRALANEIQSLIREQGGFAGRWGGDEFIGIVPLGGEDACARLSAMCRRLEATQQPDGFRMTISVGVTDSYGLTSLSALSEKADLALYESKENGRNQASLYRTDMDAAPAIVTASSAAAAGQNGAAVPAEQKSLEQSAPAQEGAPADDVGTRTGFRSFLARLVHYIRSRLIESTVLGVRWMAPFVAGGGILIGLAFLFDAASVDLSSLSVAARSQFGSITPLAASLKSIGGITFNFMLPVFAGFMAYGIAGEGAFMAGFAGGYICTAKVFSACTRSVISNLPRMNAPAILPSFFSFSHTSAL
jgi:diguanylate cyclase (GGDEF)-like protein